MDKTKQSEKYLHLYSKAYLHYEGEDKLTPEKIRAAVDRKFIDEIPKWQWAVITSLKTKRGEKNKDVRPSSQGIPPVNQSEKKAKGLKAMENKLSQLQLEMISSTYIFVCASIFIFIFSVSNL